MKIGNTEILSSYKGGSMDAADSEEVLHIRQVLLEVEEEMREYKRALLLIVDMDCGEASEYAREVLEMREVESGDGSI